MDIKKEKPPVILSIGTANPEKSYTQEEIYKITGYKSKKIESIFLNSGISKRYLFLTGEDPVPNENPDELHRRYKKGSIKIGAEAVRRCLENAKAEAKEIDFIIATSCTGYLCPGLSSIMVKEFKMRENIQRTDIQGMGCAGAMPSLQRAYDHVKAYPLHKVLLLCVEICSAAYYIDGSMETIIGNAICSDGAAAMLISNGFSGPGQKILDFQSEVDSEFLDSVGFCYEKGRLKIILGKEIQKLAGPSVNKTVNKLIGRNGLEKKDIKHWVIHPGGRNVIENIREGLGLTEEQIRCSKSILNNFGNMSSPTVIFVLEETIKNGNAKDGDYGVMIALGPGLAAETALLRWQE